MAPLQSRRESRQAHPRPCGPSHRASIPALAGLHAAHELTDDDGKALEIVHRDVSPHNILVGVDGVSRITDFGIARAATRLAVTQSGQLKGKLAYMAPEQARSETVDRRADVFSMGICLWEMLAGQRLFKSEFEAETLNRLLYDPIPTLTSVSADVPAEIEAVCMKALTRDPDKRYATAAEFADALEQAARPYDLVGGKRVVSRCVDEVRGSDLAERREAIRAWRVESEPGRAVTTGSYAALPGSQSSGSVSDVISSSGRSQPEGSALVMAPVSHRGASIGVALVAAALALASGLFEWNRACAEARLGRLPPPHIATSFTPPAQLPTPGESPSAAPVVPNAAISDTPPAPIPTPVRTAAPPPASAIAAPVRSAPPRQPSKPPGPAAVASDMMVNPYR